MFVNQLCRLCGNVKTNLFSIFGSEGIKLDIATKIIKCLQIWIYPEDPLPQYVCTDCYSLLSQSFQFYESTSRVQEALQAQLNAYLRTGNYADTFEIIPQTSSVKNDVAFNGEHFMNDYKLEAKIELNETNNEAYDLSIKSNNHKENQNEESKDEIDYGNDIYSETIETEPVSNDESENYSKNNESPDEIFLISKFIPEHYPWYCSECYDSMESPQELSKHYNETHNIQPRYLCLHCLKPIDSYKSFYNHMMYHFNKSDWDENSPECKKCHVKVKDINIHKTIHLPKNKMPNFECPKCEKKFLSETWLENHDKITHKDNPFTCYICGKVLSFENALKAHMKTHLPKNNPHICKVCNKSFSKKCNLKQHEIHHMDKKYACTYCDKKFRVVYALNEHKTIHTGERPYQCHVCSKFFRLSATLRTHMLQHTGERPYKCMPCSRGFTNLSNFGLHMRTWHKGVVVKGKIFYGEEEQY